MLHMRNNREETQTVTPDEDRCGIRNGVMLPWLTLLAAHLDSGPRAGTASIVSTKLLNMTEASVGPWQAPYINDNCNTYSAKLQERALLSTVCSG